MQHYSSQIWSWCFSFGCSGNDSKMIVSWHKKCWFGIVYKEGTTNWQHITQHCLLRGSTTLDGKIQEALKHVLKIQKTERKLLLFIHRYLKCLYLDIYEISFWLASFLKVYKWFDWCNGTRPMQLLVALKVANYFLKDIKMNSMNHELFSTGKLMSLKEKVEDFSFLSCSLSTNNKTLVNID